MFTGPSKTARLRSGEQLKGGSVAQSRRMDLSQAPQRSREELPRKLLQYVSSSQLWELVRSGQPGPTDTTGPGSKG